MYKKILLCISIVLLVSIFLGLVIFLTDIGAENQDEVKTTPNIETIKTSASTDKNESPEENTGSVGLAFQPLSGGTCYISGIGACTDSVISIPRFIDGYEVIGINDKAFYNCSNITSVIIPEGVVSIGNYAFHKCTNLVEVSLPNSITTIGAQAFADCRALAGINIPDGVTRLEYNTFWGCGKLKNITIPISVTFIDSGVLSSNNIESIYFKGTRTQWGKITIYDYYYSFRKYTIYCADGSITPSNTN